MISLSCVCFTKKEVSLLDSVSVSIENGETAWISGPSGSGKSLLFQLLHGLLPVSRGLYRFGERTVQEKRDRYVIRRWISAIYQNPTLIAADTVRENLLLAEFESSRTPQLFDSEWERLTERFELTRILDKPVATLSHAQKKAASAVRAFLRPSKLLLADEPFQGLESRITEALGEEMERVAACGSTVIILSSSDPVPAAFNPSRRFQILAGRLLERSRRGDSPLHPRAS